MVYGILEDKYDVQPLGTSTLEEKVDTRLNPNLSNARIILVPEPSNSPDDPLNFSRLKKEITFLILIFGTCATATIGPLFIPGFVVLSKYFHEPVHKISLLNGCLIITLGVGSYIYGGLAVILGKRLIFLTTVVIVIITACWGASADSYSSLLGARIIQGFGMGGFFALAGSASINDLFFVHQRATRVGIWNAAIIGATNLAPIVSGYVISALSWRWSFWFLAIAFGVLLVATYLLFPETNFDRSGNNAASVFSNKLSNVANEADLEKDDENDYRIHDKNVSSNDRNHEVPGTTSSNMAVPAQATSVSLWRRILRVEKVQYGPASQVIPLLTRPLLLVLHPSILWSSTMWAATFGWGVIVGLVASQIFAAPPYSLKTSSIGNLVGIAPLIGSTIAAPITGRASDYLCRWFALRNKGVFEPEFRLPLLIPFTVIIALGAFGLGAAIDHGLSTIVCGVFLAILNFGIALGATVCVSYSNDVSQHRAGEALGVAMLIKSAYAFGISFAANQYYQKVGALRFFGTFASVNIGIAILGALLWVWGKRIRSWSGRVGILGRPFEKSLSKN